MMSITNGFSLRSLRLPYLLDTLSEDSCLVISETYNRIDVSGRPVVCTLVRVGGRPIV